MISDAAHIAQESKASIKIDLGQVPFAETVRDADHALEMATYGDDYQTLFTAPETDKHRLLATAKSLGLHVSPIGVVRAGEGIKLSFNGADVPSPVRTGYRH